MKGLTWIVMTPGVGLDDKGDGLGQQYRTVDEVVTTGTDIIIVGRGLFGQGRDPNVEGQEIQRCRLECILKKDWLVVII